MSISKFTIRLNDVSFHAYHGVLQQEQIVGNTFTVNLTVNIAADTQLILENRLEATVSYASLYNVLEEEMKIPSELLETLALRIALRIRRSFPTVESGIIEIKKEHPPIQRFIGSASVIYNF